MPVYDFSPMFVVLLQAPLELVPMNAVLAVLHQKSSGATVGTCVVSCHQVAGALRHLGFDATPLAAAATVYRTLPKTRQPVALASDVGIYQEPPTVTDEGTTNGHMVVHARNFGQMIDPTIVQDQTILTAAYRDVLYSIPAVVPVPADPAQLAEIEPLYTYDDTLHVTWTIFPDWTHRLDAVLTAPDAAEAATRGAAGLAHDALQLMCDLTEEGELFGLPDVHPHLEPLLTGHTHLPPT